MRQYLVRTSCEYSMLITAESAQEAIEKFKSQLDDSGIVDESWSQIEIDEDCNEERVSN